MIRRFAVVAWICLVLSTQILFQAGILENPSIESVAMGWRDYFLEVFLCGTSMFVAFEALKRLRPRRVVHSIAVIVAMAFASFLAECAAMVLLQPPGFYPPLLALAGDSLRWAIFGSIVFLAHENLLSEMRTRAALDATRIERASLDKQMLEAQLEVLRAQIEPHFLFNTLAHVKRLYEVRRETGDEILSSLRHYLRAALPTMRASGCTVWREAELVEAYLRILRIRLGKRLEFSFEIGDEARQQPLPPMMLITLVENAIKHGIGPQPEGGHVVVRARCLDNFLEVDVADTGAGFSGSLGNGVGLANIRARLRGLHGERASLALRHNNPRGVVACVRIPLDALEVAA